MLRAALAVLLLMCARLAQADSMVNLCGSGIRSGAGTDVARALASGGRITFSCGGASTININCSHALSADAEIDGGDRVTLRGNAGTRMRSIVVRLFDVRQYVADEIVVAAPNITS